MVPVPVSFPALVAGGGGGSALPLAVRRDGAIGGGAALVLVFELEGVAAGGRGGRSRGWRGGRRRGEGVGLGGLWRVRGDGCSDLIGRHVLHLGRGSLGPLERVWVEDGLPLLGRLVDGELGRRGDWSRAVRRHRHPTHHHLGPRPPAVLLVQPRLHRHAVRGSERFEGQRGGRLGVGAALLEGAGPIAARAQVGGRPQAAGVQGPSGEGLPEVAVQLVRFRAALPPLPVDAAGAGAALAEDVGLRGAVVFEVAAVPRVDLRQVRAAIGLFRQALKEVLARRAVREELLKDRKE